MVWGCALEQSLEALVITHENTREERYDTYLSECLQPVRPLLVFGRPSKAKPGCPNWQAVYDWWKDSIEKIHQML